MSETASFVDPVFLARFGLARFNAIDYFLHPLNPFRTKSSNTTTSNEVLLMQGITIGTLMQQGTGMKPGPLTLTTAEEEYALALMRLTGEQYELMSCADSMDISSVISNDNNNENNNATEQQQQQQQQQMMMPSALFTIRHVLRSNPTTVKVLGIYYILEGVIYKAPSVRGLMKSNVTRTLEGLSDACDALSVCARYEPSTGYTWHFDSQQTDDDDNDDDDNNNNDPNDKEEAITLNTIRSKRKRMRRVLDNRRPGERTAEEEEGIRASEAIDRILVRLSKSPVVVSGKTTTTTTTTL